MLSSLAGMSSISSSRLTPSGRLVSLDVFRGLTMFFLVAEGAQVYRAFMDPALSNTIWSSIAIQFTHHPWNGLRFWDLIQPFFMFIVGVAMPFSFARRWKRGDPGRRLSATSFIALLCFFSLAYHSTASTPTGWFGSCGTF